jgi:hypothetical protein
MQGSPGYKPGLIYDPLAVAGLANYVALWQKMQFANILLKPRIHGVPGLFRHILAAKSR